MRFTLLYLLGFLMASHTATAQRDRWCQSCDTLLLYQPEVTEYHFVLESRTQGLYWDTLSHFAQQPYLYIRNNTGVPVRIIRVGGGDGAFLFHSRVGAKTFTLRAPPETWLQPDSFLVVKPRLYSRRCPFNRSLHMQYEKQGERQSSSIMTWGCIPPYLKRD